MRLIEEMCRWRENLVKKLCACGLSADGNFSVKDQMTEDKKLVRLYLLGQLGEDLQYDLEERYFVDDDLYQTLLQTEDELIEDYAERRLNQEDLWSFEERYFENPEKRRKVELTIELIRRSSEIQFS